MNKLVYIIFLVILVVSNSWAADKRYDVPVGDSPVYGPAEAPVTIIEFLDYQ